MNNRYFYKDADWKINDIGNQSVSNTDAQLAVLMDIRKELRKLNLVVQCKNFLELPRILKGIRLNTTKMSKK